MSDTPKTDAKERESEKCEAAMHAHYGWKFARTIERELNAAQQEIERLTATIAAKDEAIKRLNGWLDNDRRALGEE